MSTAPQLTIRTLFNNADLYSDSRGHGYQGPSRNVRCPRVTPPGGGLMAKSEDGMRCAVTGRESLRIVNVTDPSQIPSQEQHRSVTGKGGHRIEVSRNLWESSGLKIDSASTDVAWGYGLFNSKVLTSGRNGELIMWDINKNGPSKCERRSKDHTRAINKLSVSQIVHHYCITGSADGHMRVWDLRNTTKSIVRIHYSTSLRSLVFSPSPWQPLQAMVGLDNGSIYRWDLKMGQRGQLDRLSVAHSAPVTTLDWCCAGGISAQGSVAIAGPQNESGVGGLGWIVSGGMDRCVKVWDLTSPTSNSHIPQKPTYTLHPSFPVRRVAWRPGYECELAIASSSEFSLSETSQPSPGPTASGLVTRVGSSLGLDNLLRIEPESIYAIKEKLNAQLIELKAASQGVGPADAVEIWDVRRPWIAKWSVSGSSAEGGITDIAFRDSHALWAQNASGSFSQLDLRDTTKPLDSIPRSAVTWAANGSLTFVADRKDIWEIPFDDISPEYQRHATETGKTKALGDPPYTSKKQIVGSFMDEFSVAESEIFHALAQRYIFDGKERPGICVYNSKVAHALGQDVASQIWLLLGACLTKYIPDSPPPPPLPIETPGTVPPTPRFQRSPQHPSAPLASSYAFPPPLSHKGSDTSSIFRRLSPSQRPTTLEGGRSASGSTSRRLTPNSSANSSPLHIPSSLPPMTPRRASFFGRRDSGDANIAKGALRRGSLSTTPGTSASPAAERPAPKLKGVGEGLLDGSDSSEEEEDDDGEDTAGPPSSDDDFGLHHSALSPASIPNRSNSLSGRSSLSRLAENPTWSDEEAGHDDGASPSPQSSDSESDRSGSANHSKPGRSSRRNSVRARTRSRSSTVASLAAPPPPPRPLQHQDSQSSIRTVTVQEAGLRDREYEDVFVRESSAGAVYRPPYGHQKSQTMSEMVSLRDRSHSLAVPDSVMEIQKQEEIPTTDRHIDVITEEDERFKEMTLTSLKEALEDFADAGDVQLCALLALVAPKELRLSERRAMRFIEAYIERLERAKLFTCAAYIRKYCPCEEVQKRSLVETVIYTACGKCKKAIAVPAGTFEGNRLTRGAYSYCKGCKVSCVLCSICHLPVRSLLIQCSVCQHGGHRKCYAVYYSQRPMEDLPTSFLPPSSSEDRGRQPTRSAPPSTVDDDASSTISAHSSAVDPLDASERHSPVPSTHAPKIVGHPCAAGCGHYCWAASRFVDDI